MQQMVNFANTQHQHISCYTATNSTISSTEDDSINLFAEL